MALEESCSAIMVVVCPGDGGYFGFSAACWSGVEEEPSGLCVACQREEI